MSCELRASSLLRRALRIRLACSSRLEARGWFVGNLGLCQQNLVNARERCGAALEDADDPSQGNHGPGELGHVLQERDKLAHTHFALEDFSPTQPENDDNRGSEHEFERWPEHAHEADKAQAAAYVFPIGGFEGVNLGLLLDVGANDAGAGKIFLSAGRNVGEHGLNALKALVNTASEVLDDDAGNRQREESEKRELWAQFHHVRQREDGQGNRICGVHDGRAEQIAHGVQVICGARHDVAGAIALIIGVRERFKVREEVVAEIEFNVA